MDNVEYQAAETFSIVLSRPDQSISWGFRLQGGFDFSTPLSIQVVQPNSIAESCGLLAGDGILQINNTNADGLTHENAKMEIIRSGNDISLVVQRGAVKIWKPKVTPLSDLRPEELKPIKTATGEEIVAVQKTSLAIKQQEEPCNIGSSHNRSARPFQAFASSAAEALPQQYQQQQYQPPPQPQPQQQYQQQQYQPPPQPQQQYQQQQYQPPSQQPYQQQQQPVPSAGQQFQPQSNIPAPPPPPPLSNKQAVPSVVHAQYNTPISLYSAGNIAETYSAQTQSISEQMQRMDVGQVPSGSKATPSGFVQSPTSPDARVPSGFRSVTAPKTDMQAVQQQQQKRESMRCGDCDMLVTGVFVRVKGVPYHAGCFKCTSCSMNLKQKGYFVVDNKLYCEIHAKRVAQSPGADMVAVPVYR